MIIARLLSPSPLVGFGTTNSTRTWEPTLSSDQQLQRKLYLAAKKCRERRFHALYDRIFRPDVLWAGLARSESQRRQCRRRWREPGRGGATRRGIEFSR